MDPSLTLGPTAQDTFRAFVDRASSDPAVVGLILSGSSAREGMATARSDYDVYVMVDDAASTELSRLDGFRSAHLDLSVFPLAELRTHAMPGGTEEYNRYSFVGAQVLLDRRDGLIAELVAQKAALSPQEARDTVRAYLDAYVNSLYRSLKSDRDGRPGAARLDAAESLPFLLKVVFALHGRVCPYNKYLQWELETRPLGAPQWAADAFLPRLHRILDDADPDTQRAAFADAELAARAAGHHAVLDAWGAELELLRLRS